MPNIPITLTLVNGEIVSLSSKKEKYWVEKAIKDYLISNIEKALVKSPTYSLSRDMGLLKRQMSKSQIRYVLFPATRQTLIADKDIVPKYRIYNSRFVWARKEIQNGGHLYLSFFDDPCVPKDTRYYSTYIGKLQGQLRFNWKYCGRNKDSVVVDLKDWNFNISPLGDRHRVLSFNKNKKDIIRFDLIGDYDNDDFFSNGKTAYVELELEPAALSVNLFEMIRRLNQTVVAIKALSDSASKITSIGRTADDDEDGCCYHSDELSEPPNFQYFNAPVRRDTDE
jgi:hypothetical protein